MEFKDIFDCKNTLKRIILKSIELCSEYRNSQDQIYRN